MTVYQKVGDSCKFSRLTFNIAVNHDSRRFKISPILCMHIARHGNKEGNKKKNVQMPGNRTRTVKNDMEMSSRVHLCFTTGWN